MSEDIAGQEPRAWLASALAFIRWTTPREPVPRRAIRADAAIAGVALVLALIMTGRAYSDTEPVPLIAAVVATVPLAARRWYPLTAFLILVAGVIAAKDYATDLSFLTIVFAGYSAVVHSRFRGLSLLCVALAGLVIADVFWKGQGGMVAVNPIKIEGPGAVRVVPGPAGVFVPQGARWRFDGLITLLALVGIAVLRGAGHARDRIRRLQAEHAAATERALEAERARIASELHDVVTHNVSVMIVQAGAARQVLDAAPGEARAALLAVESSGRAAMAELRHLLGLLNPVQHGPEAADASAGDPALPEQELRPQPGLSQLPGLVGRMREAGLAVDLHVGELPPGLPPGLDLAAFRVVQEALTNVLKHAGKPATSVTVDYLDGRLILGVTDSGRPIPAIGPVAVPGSGRGLTGLRERVGVYGGDIEAGPQPGGGWRLRARIPVGAAVSGPSDAPEPAPAAGR